MMWQICFEMPCLHTKGTKDHYLKNYKKKKRNRFVTRAFTELKMLSITAQFWKLSLKNTLFGSEILYGEQIGYVICLK